MCVGLFIKVYQKVELLHLFFILYSDFIVIFESAALLKNHYYFFKSQSIFSLILQVFLMTSLVWGSSWVNKMVIDLFKPVSESTQISWLMGSIFIHSFKGFLRETIGKIPHCPMLYYLCLPNSTILCISLCWKVLLPAYVPAKPRTTPNFSFYIYVHTHMCMWLYTTLLSIGLCVFLIFWWKLS